MNFQKRRFQKPVVRLIKTLARTKGSYTFEVFAYEEKSIQQFIIRFLPDAPYYAINFIKATTSLDPEDEIVLEAVQSIEQVVQDFRPQWEGKKSIKELTYNFILLLIDSQEIEIPEEMLSPLQEEILRIFHHPEMVKLDKKGRPYFTNAHYGKFFISDIGPMSQEDLKRHQLHLQ